MSDRLCYKGYSGSVDNCTEDHVLHGRVIGISDLVTFEASSVSELKSAFRKSVEDYIKTCRELKKEPDRPFNN
ncbi:MAG: type II toxin-antitoxin system HicB family antitoxin [Bacteroidota bacterium]